MHSRNHIRSTQYWMAKRKEPEEDSKDSGFYKEIVVSTIQVEANVGCSKDSLDVKLAEGGTSRKESNEEGVGSSVPVVTIETIGRPRLSGNCWPMLGIPLGRLPGGCQQGFIEV